MRMALSPCNPKMIASAFTTKDMSSSLRDCQPSQEGPEGQRGQGHHEREGTQAGVCDSPDDGAAVDAGEGGRPWARASWTGEAVEPADCGVGQGDCAEAVRVAVWGFLADVAAEKLAERHGITLSAETVRGWLRDAGLPTSPGGSGPIGRDENGKPMQGNSSSWTARTMTGWKVGDRGVC